MTERQKLLNERDIELNIQYTNYTDIGRGSDDDKDKDKIMYNVNNDDDIDMKNHQSRYLEMEKMRPDSSHLKSMDSVFMCICVYVYMYVHLYVR
jgi:hypothetical protein